jgi:predicted secreted protein
MPAPVSRTKGTLLKIGDGGSPEAFLSVGRIFNVGELAGERERIEVTTHDSPGDAKEYLGGTIDYGNQDFQYRYSPTDPGQVAVEAKFDSGEAVNVQVVYPNGKRRSYTGIVIRYATSEAPVDGVLNGSFRLAVSSKPILENAA